MPFMSVWGDNPLNKAPWLSPRAGTKPIHLLMLTMGCGVMNQCHYIRCDVITIILFLSNKLFYLKLIY